jgi:hypothetical protein
LWYNKHKEVVHVGNPAGEGDKPSPPLYRPAPAYGEVVTGLFGNVKGIEVKGKEEIIKVSGKVLLDIYRPLNLSGDVFKKVVKAHNDVLQTGISTGLERVIAIDRDTGEVVDDKIGTPEFVVWKIDKEYTNDVITIHNHPNSTPFSPLDLFSFNDIRQTRHMSVQGHDGTVYAMYKPHNKKFLLTKDVLKKSFDITKNLGLLKGRTFKEKGEIFNKGICSSTGWTFRKGV